MSQKISFQIIDGFESDQKAQVTRLFWDAFKQKLSFALKPEEKAFEFLELVIDADHAISAVNFNGDVIGVAGFKTDMGAFVGGGIKELCQVYGPFGGIWRAGVLLLLDRSKEKVTLLMDGLFVSDKARGLGVGSALLNAIKKEASKRGYSRVRLDVIDSNPRARALYEREGFVAEDTSDFGPLRYFFGFQEVTTMFYEVE